MRIDFPQRDPQPSFMGRNGYYHSQALEIEVMACGLVSLQPVTTKGKTGRCTIELPADAKTLRAVAGELLWIAEELQR